jgi:hypothetical protein
MPKSCSSCGHPSQLSLVVSLSTVGVSPRLQASSVAVPVCAYCLKVLPDWLFSEVLVGPVYDASTKLNQRLSRRSKARS